MSACKWMADMLLTMFTVYLFFLYFGMFFERRKKNIRVLLGVIVLVLWQVGIPEVINELPKAWNIGTTVGLALFVVANVFEGKAWMKSIFCGYICSHLDAGGNADWQRADDLWGKHRGTADFWCVCFKVPVLPDHPGFKESIYK